jgi:hypothetical protein
LQADLVDPLYERRKKLDQGKPWQRKYKRHLEAEKKDPEEIPIRYEPIYNLVKLKEARSKAVLKNYGNVGKLIKQGSYCRHEEPDRKDAIYNRTQISLIKWLTVKT